jgi:hypothetical protein
MKDQSEKLISKGMKSAKFSEEELITSIQASINFRGVFNASLKSEPFGQH